MFTISAPRCTLRVVAFHGAPQTDQWERYAAEYRLMLQRAPSPFVLLFDLSGLQWDLESIGVFALRKLSLTRALKPHTCRLVQAVVVHTSSQMLADIVNKLVQAAGQSAPFSILADPLAVEARVRNAETLVQRPVPAWQRGSPAKYVPMWETGVACRTDAVGLSWRDICPPVFMLLMLVLFANFVATLSKCAQAP